MLLIQFNISYIVIAIVTTGTGLLRLLLLYMLIVCIVPLTATPGTEKSDYLI